VLARVTIGRTIATQCDAALLAGAEMDPRVARLHTFGAFANFWLLDRIDGVQMKTTAIAHGDLPLLTVAMRSWILATAIPPSPTAAAQRFTDPERTSPAAKIPGALVSSGVG